MLRLPRLLVLTLAVLCSCTSTRVRHFERESRAQSSPLKLASWNLEFLAEHDGAGCEPRVAADYAAMRRIADSLGADVIAFQEAANLAAAARVFDPARYTIVMEDRPGAVSGTCGVEHPNQPFVRRRWVLR